MCRRPRGGKLPQQVRQSTTKVDACNTDPGKRPEEWSPNSADSGFTQRATEQANPRAQTHQTRALEMCEAEDSVKEAKIGQGNRCNEDAVRLR
eukprot:2172728-Karenia_brevis.AAC.1